MKKLMYVLVSLFILAACQSNKEQDELRDEVMSLHDEVMPKMDDIMELKTSIENEIKELSQDSTVSASKIQKLEDAKKQLEDADRAMMEWMRQFKTDFDDMAKEEIMNYLQTQKSRIEKVGQEMNRAIDHAKTILDEKENDQDHV